MAKEFDLEKEKATPETATDSAEEKGAKSEKAVKKSSKDTKDGKAKKDKKAKKSIVKYFKDARAEFKKVVWPTPKTTTKNTVVVLIVCGLAALFIFGIDTLFGLLNKLILG